MGQAHHALVPVLSLAASAIAKAAHNAFREPTPSTSSVRHTNHPPHPAIVSTTPPSWVKVRIRNEAHAP